jgi:hypothetical protein
MKFAPIWGDILKIREDIVFVQHNIHIKGEGKYHQVGFLHNLL